MLNGLKSFIYLRVALGRTFLQELSNKDSSQATKCCMPGLIYDRELGILGVRCILSGTRQLQVNKF